MTPRRRAVRIRMDAEWPYRCRCFNCYSGRMSPRWTDINLWGQDVRGTALKCDRCGEILFSDRMADFAERKALAATRTTSQTSCSASTVDNAEALYLVLDANGLRLEA